MHGVATYCVYGHASATKYGEFERFLAFVGDVWRCLLFLATFVCYWLCLVLFWRCLVFWGDCWFCFGDVGFCLAISGFILELFGDFWFVEYYAGLCLEIFGDFWFVNSSVNPVLASVQGPMGAA